MRTNINILFAFSLSNICMEKIKQELIKINTKSFKEAINFIYKEQNSFMIYRIDTNNIYKNFKLLLFRL